MSRRYDPICSVPTCRRPHWTGGYCDRHAERLRATGQLERLSNNVYGVYLRFWKYVLTEDVLRDGCWLWQGPRVHNGYGIISIQGSGVKTTIRAHRYAYEALVGPIPEGLQLDHLCRVRRCVNPAHLEPVTARENVRRGVRARVQAAAAAPVQLTIGAGASDS